MNRSDMLTGGLLLAAMVVVPGLIARLLVAAGPGQIVIFGYASVVVTVSMVVFFAFYLLAAVLIWYRFIRPLDLQGPTDRDMPDEVETSSQE